MGYHLELSAEHFKQFRVMQVRADIAASFQRVALEHLEDRVARAAGWALEEWPGIKHLVVAGGVAANQLLRFKLQVCCWILTPVQSQHSLSWCVFMLSMLLHSFAVIIVCPDSKQLSVQRSITAWLIQACAGRHLRRSRGWSSQCHRRSCARTTA